MTSIFFNNVALSSQKKTDRGMGGHDELRSGVAKPAKSVCAPVAFGAGGRYHAWSTAVFVQFLLSDSNKYTVSSK